MVQENALNIYTDGSSYSRPRRGGIAIRYVTIDEQGDEVVRDDLLQGHEGATNNEMELMACIRALEGARDHESIHLVERVYIFTDSMYVTENLQRAKFEWPKLRWRNHHGRPIDNAPLWKNLVSLIKNLPKRVEFKWVKGHSKDPHNRAVDKLAKQSAKAVLNRSLRVTAVRRKISPHSVQAGSGPMRGQTLSVRIITDTYMRLQRVYKYKYEVLSDSGEHAENVDWIYSRHCLRAGHHYEVRVNEDARNPQIAEVLRELERS
jgi:ribonuclease HI